MNSSQKRTPVALVLGLVVLAVAVIAVIKRDTIAGLILKGGDISLIGEPAQSSPQAKLALDFLAALRRSDLNAVTALVTAEQAVRIQQEAQQPTPEFQDLKAMMLDDLPAEPAALKGLIKSVQIHKNRGVVTFETKANSWFVTLDRVNGVWRIAAF